MDVHAVTPDELRGGGEAPTALTFDDVLLVPWHSQVLPTQVDVATRETRRIRVHVPIVSAAIDTVTESRLAIAMAQQGGLGVIHKNLTVEEQASEVDRVKRSESGMIVNPITLRPALRPAPRMRSSSGFSPTRIARSAIWLATPARNAFCWKNSAQNPGSFI